jgi:hypothetical protein
MKKRQWTVRRQTVECPDAQRRWDRSYQYLVQWSAMVDKDLSSGPQSQVVSLLSVGTKRNKHNSQKLLNSPDMISQSSSHSR